MAGIAHVGLADVLCEQDAFDAALEHAETGIERCTGLANRMPLAAGWATLARIRQALGDPAGALAAIREAERAGLSPEMTDLFNPVPVQRARLMLAQGDVAEAARWTAQRALSAEDEPSYHREREHLVLARVLLAEGRPDQACTLLGRLLEAAEAAGRTGSAIEIQALHALALRAAGERERAARVLSRALAPAAPEGYVRVFVDEGPPMAELLADVLAARHGGWLEAPVPAHYLRKLLAALERDAPGEPQPATALADPLSERELEVLALIAAGKSNPEIARELVIELSTVKTHVQNLYRKLEVRNRAQAVARAGELTLL